MMGGKIDCYLDIASLYSYLAFLEIEKNRNLLASHNVEIEYHPVLLGAINAGSGNKPPWTLPAKARHGAFETRRAIARHRAVLPPAGIAFPRDLFKSGMTVVPLRCLHHIKRRYPSATTAVADNSDDRFLSTLHYLFRAFWAPPNRDLTTREGVAAALAEVPRGFARVAAAAGVGNGEQTEKLFTADEVREIVEAAGTEEIKTVVKRCTQEALDKGAFGAPWLWVTNASGQAEPFFGSDRFHFVYEFLGLPYSDVTLLPAGGEKGKL